MKTLKLLVLATVLAASPACKKKKTEPTPTPVTEPGSASGAMATPDAPDMAGSGSADPTMGSAGSGSAAAGSGSAAAAPADPNADYIQVLAEHAEKKPTDPVVVSFDKFTVKKATFDPKKIEGGTATIEVDLASLKSGSDKRDAHLTTADYIDAKKFTTMTIDVVNVKKKDDTHYTADAKVKMRGVDKTYPVAFEVVEAKDDWIRVKGEHKFGRMDFKVGKEKTGPDESVAQELTVKLQLTLKKT
jgi:polyisoprenoid-binding protein YceI